MMYHEDLKEWVNDASNYPLVEPGNDRPLHEEGKGEQEAEAMDYDSDYSTTADDWGLPAEWYQKQSIVMAVDMEMLDVADIPWEGYTSTETPISSPPSCESIAS